MKKAICLLTILNSCLVYSQNLTFKKEIVEKIEIEAYYRIENLNRKKTKAKQELFVIDLFNTKVVSSKYIEFSLQLEKGNIDTTKTKLISESIYIDFVLIQRLLNSLESSQIFTLNDLNLNEDSIQLITNNAFQNSHSLCSWPYSEDTLVKRIIFNRIGSLEMIFNRYLKQRWDFETKSDGSFSNSLGIKIYSNDTIFYYWSNYLDMFQPMHYFEGDQIVSVFNLKTRQHLYEILPHNFFTKRFLNFEVLTLDFIDWVEEMGY